MNDGFKKFIAAPERDRLDIFLAASRRLGTAVQNVEKDFWVCWTLDVLYHGIPPGSPGLLFKGGTSLSKAHGLIRRFSEDIDITVFREDLKQAASIEDMEKLSGKKRKAKLDAIRDACRAWVAGPLRESLAAHINAFVPKDGRIELDPEDADGQTLLVWFRTIASSQSGYVQPAVRIECGAKSALDPHRDVLIRPYIAEDAPELNISVVTCGAAVLVALAAFLAWRSLHSRTSDATPIHSIAVLPFANASKDPEMDYLGEGISEEITNSLSRLPNLQVMARSTVSHYKSRQDDPQGVGHDLRVDAVLTGRVVEHGTELNVETELVNVATGAQLWGERYTRSANDASLLQAAITRDVASQLRPQLSGAEQADVAKVGTRDAEAYQFYLKGRYRFERYAPQDFEAAAELFNQAIARDPSYAVAYAGLADVYANQAYNGLSGRETYGKARAMARRALELDPQNSEAHISLATVDMLFFRNFSEAESEIRKGLALDPSSPYAHQVSSWFNMEMGRIQEAVTESRKAVELDPLSPFYNSMLGFAYYYQRDYEPAIKQHNKTLEIDPNYAPAVYGIGDAYWQMGNYKQAMDQRIKAAQLGGYEKHAKELSETFEKLGYKGALRKHAKDSEAAGYPYGAACDYAMLGEKDAAFEALEQAAAAGNHIDTIKLDPALDNLRSDPRYADLLGRIGLPQ